MKVMQVFSAGTFKRGGPMSIAALVKDLNEYEDIETIAVLPIKKDGEASEWLESHGIKTYSLPFVWCAHYPDSRSKIVQLFIQMLRYVVKAYDEWRVVRIAKKEQVDLVHIGDGIIDIGFQAASRNNLPLIWHMREYVTLDHGMSFDNPGDMHKKLLAADRVICVSNSVRDHFSSLIPGIDAVAVYDGVSYARDFKRSEASHPKESGPGKGALSLAFLGGVRESKGIFDALDALYILKLRGTENLHLDIFGSMEDHDRALFEEKLQDYGLGSMVTYQGWKQVGIGDIAKYDAELVCSRMEAFGRVTAEGMLAKTLIIGADSGATSELLACGRGLLYEQGDSESLANAIQTVLNGEIDISQIVKKAFEFALEACTSEGCAEQVKEIYHDVMGRHILRLEAGD